MCLPRLECSRQWPLLALPINCTVVHTHTHSACMGSGSQPHLPTTPPAASAKSSAPTSSTLPLSALCLELVRNLTRCFTKSFWGLLILSAAALVEVADLMHRSARRHRMPSPPVLCSNRERRSVLCSIMLVCLQELDVACVCARWGFDRGNFVLGWGVPLRCCVLSCHNY